MSAEVPGMPPVVVQGSMVVFTGQAAADAHVLLRLAVKVLREQSARTGVTLPARFELLEGAAAKAASAVGQAPDIRTSTDVRKVSTAADSETRKSAGVGDAMRLFEVGERQARRIVEQAGGTKTRKGWRIELTALQAEYELRRSA